MSVKSMLLVDFLKKVHPAYGGTWKQAFKNLQADKHENQIIETIYREFLTNGELLNPIQIYEIKTEEEVFETVKIGDLILANGMHRVAALHKAQAEFVPITYDDPERDKSITLEFTIEGGEAFDEDDLFDTIVGVTRSFRLNEDTWLEAEGLGSTSGLYHANYVGAGLEVEEELIKLLSGRFAEEGLKLNVEAAMTTDEWFEL